MRKPFATKASIMCVGLLCAGSIATAQSSSGGTQGNPARGQQVFQRCVACHTVAGASNSVGPNLRTVIGRKVAGAPGYNYSAGLKGKGGVWTPDRIDQFLLNPQAFAPGTRMAFAGLKNPTDRADVIAFLRNKNSK